MKNSFHSPKSFLFTTWEGGGNIAPVITVARKLRERGHRVRLMSDAVNGEEAAAADIGFSPWREAPSRVDRTPASCPLRDWEAAAPPDGIKRLLDKLVFGPALEYARDLSAELDREPADLVVTSEMLLGVLAACESRGQRVAVFAPNLCLYPLPGMPAFGPGLTPPRTPEEKALHKQIRQNTIGLFNSYLDQLNRVRVALGLLPLQNALDQINIAETYLLATSRAFDFPVLNLPKQIRYVGPQLDEPAWAKAWSSPWPASDPRPLVAVGFSTTYQAHEGVLQKVVDAAAPLPVKTLVTLGQIAPERVRPAANTALVSSAPHDAVMREATVVITHGGHGTVMRALQHQLPMLIIPHGRDQDENAVRVVEHGAGLRLTAGATTEEIRTALLRLLGEPAFKDAARRLGLAIADELKRVDAAAELEALAAQPASCASAI